MKSQRQDISEDRVVKSRRRYKEPTKISLNARVNSDSIPVDLVIEILSRLPAKSIARCRCVSKLWASILRLPDLTELLLTKSQARPQLLFTCHKHETGELFFFSSPQPQYSDGNSSRVTASYRIKIPFKYKYERIWLINGIFFLRDERILNGKKNGEKVSIICNPSTRQSLVLSIEKVKTRDWLFSYFGYDSIEKQFKALSIASNHIGVDHVSTQRFQVQVLTLGSKTMSWRKIECCILHVPTYNVICINGVLYYQAYHSTGTMIVCFDIRYEKFHFMEASNYIKYNGFGVTLIDYNGKLGSVVLDEFPFRSRSFVLWILEDTEKHEWSKHIYVLPPLWKDVVGGISVLDVVGMVGGNEIVFSPHPYFLPFYVFCYNIERNTIRRIEVQGLKGSKGNRVRTFINNVEDIKPVDGY